MKITTVFIATLTVLVISGCFGEMDPISYISKFRVMGVQAEPPEVKPGEGTVLSVLFHDPADREVTVVWLTCLGLFSPGSSTPSEILGACDPVAPPAITEGSDGEATFEIPSTPTDLDLNLDAGVDDQPESVSFTVVVFMCAGGFPDGGLPSIIPDVDDGMWDMDLDTLCAGGDYLVATKAVVISKSNNPNKNPEIDSVLLNGEPISPDQPYLCGADGACTSNIKVKAFLTEDSFQEYEDQFGEIQEESPYISWFVNSGRVSEDRSRASDPVDPDSKGHGYFETTWKPKDSSGTKLWLVAHDVRGGAVWQRYQIGIPPSDAGDADASNE
jgi:hypothetical protein